MQSMPISITTDVVGSTPAQGRGVQHYVIKFVSDLRQAGRWFSPDPPPIKLTATI
jgi:hypothetical protein